MEVADAIVQNSTILRLNLQFNTHGPRVRVTEKLKQNVDACEFDFFLSIELKFMFSI